MRWEKQVLTGSVRAGELYSAVILKLGRFCNRRKLARKRKEAERKRPRSVFPLESRVGSDQFASLDFATASSTKCRAYIRKQGPQQPQLNLPAGERALRLLQPTREASNDRCRTIPTLEISRAKARGKGKLQKSSSR